MCVCVCVCVYTISRKTLKKKVKEENTKLDFQYQSFWMLNYFPTEKKTFSLNKIIQIWWVRRSSLPDINLHCIANVESFWPEPRVSEPTQHFHPNEWGGSVSAFSCSALVWLNAALRLEKYPSQTCPTPCLKEVLTFMIFNQNHHLSQTLRALSCLKITIKIF